MKKSYIVQSEFSKLYECFDSQKDALDYANCHRKDCPQISQVNYGDDFSCYEEDPNYEETTIFVFDPNDEDQFKKEKIRLAAEELAGKIYDIYKNFCLATFGKDYPLEENLGKENYEKDALDFIGIKYGYNNQKVKECLKKYKEKGSK